MTDMTIEPPLDPRHSIAILSVRHQNMVAEYAADYFQFFRDAGTNDVYWYLVGFVASMKLLWSDAESFMGQDPAATEYVCRKLAIESVMWSKLP